MGTITTTHADRITLTIEHAEGVTVYELPAATALAIRREPRPIDSVDMDVLGLAAPGARRGFDFQIGASGWGEASMAYFPKGAPHPAASPAERVAELEAIIRQIDRAVRSMHSAGPSREATYNAIMETRRLVDSANIPYIPEESNHV